MDHLFAFADLPAGAAPWLLAAALAGGLARGFSGFGTALIFVPIAAIALGPQRAAPLMLALDAFAIAALTPAAWKVADRREVGLLAAGVVVGTPLGVLVLLAADPVAMRWAMAALIAAVLALVMSGWRFRGKPGAPVSIGVGLVGGVMSGVALIGGPPVMAYLLGQDADAARIRAAFALYLCATGIVAAIAFGAAGLLGAWLFGPLLLTLPIYGAGIWAGARMFHLASAITFRRICYAMIAASALLSLPVLDGVLR
jgi:uncharacterized membrane protein YfcA